jgi:hypothetical protein
MERRFDGWSCAARMLAPGMLEQINKFAREMGREASDAPMIRDAPPRTEREIGPSSESRREYVRRHALAAHIASTASS